MESGMISQLQKARRYAEEPERVSFESMALHFKGDNNEYELELGERGLGLYLPGLQRARPLPAYHGDGAACCGRC